MKMSGKLRSKTFIGLIFAAIAPAYALPVLAGETVEFTDTVRQVSAQGAGSELEQRVIFDQHSAIYHLKKDTKGFKKMLRALSKSAKNHAAISVKADADSLDIVSVRPAPKS